jgi:hypothetical protein
LQVELRSNRRVLEHRKVPSRESRTYEHISSCVAIETARGRRCDKGRRIEPLRRVPQDDYPSSPRNQARMLRSLGECSLRSSERCWNFRKSADCIIAMSAAGSLACPRICAPKPQSYPRQLSCPRLSRSRQRWSPCSYRSHS